MISLVVCTVGRSIPLARLLRSFRRQRCEDLEIVLVDQNAPGHLDSLLAEFNDLPIRRIYSERGLSRARNKGLEQARGTIVGFPDDDCWYGAGFVERVRRFFDENPNIGVVTGRTIDANGCESVSKHLPHRMLISKTTVFQAGNSNTLFLRSSVLRDVTGFDEALGIGARFGSGEETDLLLRALAAGHIVAYEPGLTVFHQQSALLPDDQLRRTRSYAPGFGRVLRKHYGPGVLGVRVTRAVAGSLAALLRGDRAGSGARQAWARGVLAGYFARSGGILEPRVDALGVRFSPLKRTELVGEIMRSDLPDGTGARTIVTANLDHIVQLRRRDDLRNAYANAWAATADGMPVYAYARMRGVGVTERVTGSDLFADLMTVLRPDAHRCFFVASSDAVARDLADYLEKRGFAAERVGWCVPPYGFESDPAFCRDLAHRIRDHGTTHLFLGVGAPKSEVWAEHHRGLLGDCYVLSCGAALEHFTGARRRAPLALQKSGLEWLWRFAQEPVRLFPRYFVSSWAFLDAVRDDLARDRGVPPS